MNQHVDNRQVGFLKLTLIDIKILFINTQLKMFLTSFFFLQSFSTCSIMKSLVNTCTESLEIVDRKDVINLTKVHT